MVHLTLREKSAVHDRIRRAAAAGNWKDFDQVVQDLERGTTKGRGIGAAPDEDADRSLGSRGHEERDEE